MRACIPLTLVQRRQLGDGWRGMLISAGGASFLLRACQDAAANPTFCPVSVHPSTSSPPAAVITPSFSSRRDARCPSLLCLPPFHPVGRLLVFLSFAFFSFFRAFNIRLERPSSPSFSTFLHSDTRLTKRFTRRKLDPPFPYLFTLCSSDTAASFTRIFRYIDSLIPSSSNPPSRRCLHNHLDQLRILITTREICCNTSETQPHSQLNHGIKPAYNSR